MTLSAQRWRLLHRPVAADGLAQWAQRYLRACARQCSDATVRQCTQQLGRFVAWCEARGVIRAEAVEHGVLVAYAAQASAADARRARAFVRWLVEAGVLAVNPLQSMLPVYLRAVRTAIVTALVQRAQAQGIEVASVRLTRSELAAALGCDAKALHRSLQVLVRRGELVACPTAHPQRLAYGCAP